MKIDGGRYVDGTLALQYTLLDNRRKKYVLTDNSMNWDINDVRAKDEDYGASHTCDWKFSDVKDPKEYAQQLLKLVHKNFDK